MGKVMMTGCILMACAIFPGVSPAQPIGGRIVYVNMEALFLGYHKTQTADAQLKRQAEAFNVERHDLIEQLEGLRDTFGQLREDALNEALDAQVRLDRQSKMEETLMSLRMIEDRIRRFDERRTRQLEDTGQSLRRSIVEEVRRLIVDHAREQGYLAVFDSSGKSLNGVETVLYLDARHDVTSELLALLNRNVSPANGEVPAQSASTPVRP